MTLAGTCAVRQPIRQSHSQSPFRARLQVTRKLDTVRVKARLQEHALRVGLAPVRAEQHAARQVCPEVCAQRPCELHTKQPRFALLSQTRMPSAEIRATLSKSHTTRAGGGADHEAVSSLQDGGRRLLCDHADRRVRCADLLACKP